MTTMTPERSTPGYAPLRYMLSEQLQLLLVVWAGFSLFVFLLTVGVAQWREVAVSAWGQGVQAAHWYSLFIGVHVGGYILPLHLTHGQTRREFMRQAVVFVAVFAAGVSVLVTASFVMEAGLYRLGGWSQTVEAGQLA